MEERVLTKDLLVTTYADVRKDITAKTVKVCLQIIKLCICGESKILSFPVIAIGHFRLRPSLCFKTRLSGKLLTTIYFFYSQANKTHFLNKGFFTWPRFESESFCNSEKWPIIQYP